MARSGRPEEIRATPIRAEQHVNSAIWDPVASLSHAWDAVKDSPRVVFTLLPATLLVWAPWIVPFVLRLFRSSAYERSFRDRLDWGSAEDRLRDTLSVWCIPLWLWLTVGIARYSLRVARGEEARPRHLWTPAFGPVARFVLASLALGLVLGVVGGLTGWLVGQIREPPLLFVLMAAAPVLWIALRTFPYVWLCAEDRGPGFTAPWVAWQATRGRDVGVLVLWAGLAVIGFLGLALAGIGLIVTSALTHVALAHAATRIARTAAPRAPDGGRPAA